MASVKEDLYEHISAVYQTVEDEAKNLFGLLKEIWPLLFLLLLGLFLLLWFAKPAPPKKVLVATGIGSYRVLGERYKAFFEKKGIELELIPTNGSRENLAHLIDRADPIQVGFVQSGMIDPDNIQGIETLGSVDYEPLWLFYRNHIFDDRKHIEAGELARIKVSIDPTTQALNIFRLNQVPVTLPNLLQMSNEEGLKELEAGKVDAMIVVDGIESKIVQKLIADPNIHLATFLRADAYTRLMPYFEKVSVPMGGFNLANNVPDHPIELISTTTNLVIDDRLHPAIQLLFLEAAREINGGKSYFAKAGHFPAYIDSEIPLSKEASYFYQKGPPALMKYLPFWLAEFLERMFLLLGPFAAFAYPIIKSIPTYRVNLAQKQIKTIYKELEKFEHGIIASYDPAKRDEYLLILDEMERKALNSRAAKLATVECFTLRNNIEFIRNSLGKQSIYQSEMGKA